jgi:hypothetical protein
MLLREDIAHVVSQETLEEVDVRRMEHSRLIIAMRRTLLCGCPIEWEATHVE